MKREAYEKPIVSFVETELFEDVAAECWSKPYLYLFVDPTDECEQWYEEHGGKYISDAKYADMGGFKPTNNGCNDKMRGEMRAWLKEHYGSTEATGSHHFMTDADISTVFNAGGNQGTNFNGSSEYAIKVRSY